MQYNNWCILVSLGGRALVYDIMTQPPLIAKPDVTVGELLPKMKELRTRVVPVVSDGKLVGVVSYKGLLMRGVGASSRVKTVMEPPYSLNPSETINEAVAKFVLWKAKAIPVARNGILIGYLSRDRLLEYLRDSNLLPKKSVGETMTSPPTIITGGESIARARWLMLRGGISRLPVINDNLNSIEGVITMTDIVERIYIIKLTRRKGFEQFEEEFLAAPVKEFMSAPPICSVRNELIDDAVERLIEYRITGMPVIEGSNVVGVISGIDILKEYGKTLIYRELIEGKIAESLRSDEITKPQLETLLNEYLSDIRRVTNIINFKINIKEESKGGRTKYIIRTKLATDQGVMVSEGSGWDLLSAVKEALEILESRVKKYKKRGKELRRRGTSD